MPIQKIVLNRDDFIKGIQTTPLNQPNQPMAGGMPDLSQIERLAKSFENILGTVERIQKSRLNKGNDQPAPPMSDTQTQLGQTTLQIASPKNINEKITTPVIPTVETKPLELKKYFKNPEEAIDCFTKILDALPENLGIITLADEVERIIQKNKVETKRMYGDMPISDIRGIIEMARPMILSGLKKQFESEKS